MRREVWVIKSPLTQEVIATFIVEADPVREDREIPPAPKKTNGEEDRGIEEHHLGSLKYATESQIKALYAIVRRIHGISVNSEIRTQLCTIFHTATVAEISYEQAFRYIQQNQQPQQ